MPQSNRPRGRDKNITGQGKSVFRRGSGNGGGPVGGPSMNGRPSASSGSGSSNNQSRPGGFGRSSGGVTRAGGSKGGIIAIIVAVVALLGGGGGVLGGLFGGGNSTPTPPQNNTGTVISSLGSLGGLSDILGGATSFSGSNVSSGWDTKANTGTLDTTVAKGVRDRYTDIVGNGKDTVTVMVYMCGTDLESKNGMASSDLAEMCAATLSDKVNVLIYTGGCKQWKTKGISNSVNQIYKIEDGKLNCIVKDDGAKGMTDPKTLSSFIKWCAKKYPADRNELIFWDHGGGSVSGFGYDEKDTKSGSMTLSGINTALSDSKMKFDFIGFDACLMATTENALMLTKYGDYMIASEESEPGIGWYYTDWLDQISKNTSTPTIEIGKTIVDGFVDTCARKCPGQKTTLSVVDLAELEKTVPASFKDFASSTLDLLKSDEYKAVSDARSGTREFASSSKLDQVDLIHLANNINTTEGKALAKALLGAVKYNRTSSDMSNSYGLSIYFPYQKANKVDSAVKTYEAIGLDGEYAECIREFASLETCGQIATGGTASPFGSLFSSITGGSSAGATSSAPSSDMIGSLLGGFLGGSSGSTGSSGGIGSLIGGLSGSNTSFLTSILSGRSIPEVSDYIAKNSFDTEALKWEKSGKTYKMALAEDQWKLVHDLELNVFLNDGEGYIDMGLDNVFEFTDKGELLGEFDGTWLAINDQPVAYYHVSTVDDGENYTITGRVPCKLNGDRANLILVFDNANPYGYVAGATRDYVEGETETIAKNTGALENGDRIDFVADYYDYAGNYVDNYMIGEQLTVNGELTISNVYINEDETPATAAYRFTDIYNQYYWTPDIPR